MVTKPLLCAQHLVGAVEARVSHGPALSLDAPAWACEQPRSWPAQ